jgi:DNA-binding Lrp family transcriptional regulator
MGSGIRGGKSFCPGEDSPGLSGMTQSKILEIAKILSEVSRLDETELSILLLLLTNSKATNAELAKTLDFKDGNSVSYHTRSLEKEGIIKRYTIIPDWKQIGLGTEFILLAEAENEEQLLEIEKLHVLLTDEYLSNHGDIVVTPTISGCVVLENVYHCFGDKTMAIIVGRATSDQDAAVYCKNYLVAQYPNIKINMLINKYKTVNNLFIDTNAVKKLKEYFQFGKNTNVSNILDELSRMQG